MEAPRESPGLKIELSCRRDTQFSISCRSDFGASQGHFLGLLCASWDSRLSSRLHESSIFDENCALAYTTAQFCTSGRPRDPSRTPEISSSKAYFKKADYHFYTIKVHMGLPGAPLRGLWDASESIMGTLGRRGLSQRSPKSVPWVPQEVPGISLRASRASSSSPGAL